VHNVFWFLACESWNAPMFSMMMMMMMIFELQGRDAERPTGCARCVATSRHNSYANSVYID